MVFVWLSPFAVYDNGCVTYMAANLVFMEAITYVEAFFIIGRCDQVMASAANCKVSYTIFCHC